MGALCQYLHIFNGVDTEAANIVAQVAPCVDVPVVAVVPLKRKREIRERAMSYGLA